MAFAVACTTPGPGTGTLEIATVTTGSAQDADGYLISIDGGTGQPIGTNATVTLANVSAALHTVQLLGLAANCGVTGGNPLGVAIGAGETGRVSFAVTCAATVGELRVTIAGLPAGAPAAVTVAGPNGFSQPVTETRTLTALAPGSYTVSAVDVVAGATTYTQSVSRSPVPVTAGATATVTVTYTGSAAPTLNLSIDGLYLTQSTQTYTSGVPLVPGRAGYLRVFVLANEENTARPTVRVRFRNGSSTTTRTIEAPGGSTPRTVQEGTLGSSWNLPVEAALIRAGLSIEASVDPGGSITESNENDNLHTKALTFSPAPPVRIRFVSIQQGSSAPGNISNPDQLMALARRLHPLNEVDVDVHPTVFTASAPLLAGTNGVGDGWSQLLSDLDGLRVDEGSNRTYFGIVKVAYGRNDGLVGLAFPERPTAVGWDDPSDASRVVAHELGHTWGRRHSPCGNPPAGTIDGQYPYTGGTIGVFGFDVAAGSLKAPSVPDIMGYCVNPVPWTSDYTYRAVMDFRQANPGSVVASAVPQPSLLIWGRIVNGRPVLEPAFEIVTQPSLPTRSGRYSITVTGLDGSRLFTLSFDVAEIEDAPAGNGHFAFAVPLNQAGASRLGSIRLEGPSGGTSQARAPAQLRAGPASESIVASRQGENVLLRWNAAVHPMIMVRDPDTGQVLSFARGGSALVRTAKSALDLDVSDGVHSQRVRVAINR